MLHQRLDFIQAIEEDGISVAAACRAYGISRQTGYKFLARYRADGEAGLLEQSRAPHYHPQAVSSQTSQQIVVMRGRFPTWGPKKLKVQLQKEYPEQSWPAGSTIGAVLKSSGLIPTRRRNPPKAYPAGPLTVGHKPNQVWCTDFKGQFPTKDGILCYPLTLTDNSSRSLLRCHGLLSTHLALVKPIFVAAFQEYGLPDIIRSDNGTPSAANSLTGLSRLSLWWLKLGIMPERIKPGRPDQNGAHERMHRTLKAETLNPPAANLRAQQYCFDSFRQVYNEVRPHEALGQVTPATLYTPSPRPYPHKLQPFEYSSYLQTRSVRGNGTIRWDAKEIYLSEVLCGETVGLDRIEEDRLVLYVGPLPLAILDEKHSRFLSPKRAKPYLAKIRKENQTQQ